MVWADYGDRLAYDQQLSIKETVPKFHVDPYSISNLLLL